MLLNTVTIRTVERYIQQTEGAQNLLLRKKISTRTTAKQTCQH